MWSRGAAAVSITGLTLSACATAPLEAAGASGPDAKPAAMLEVTPTPTDGVFRAVLTNDEGLAHPALAQKFEALLRDHCGGAFTSVSERIVITHDNDRFPIPIAERKPPADIRDLVRCGAAPDGLRVWVTGEPGLFEGHLVKSFGRPPVEWSSRFHLLLDEFCVGRAVTSDVVIIYAQDPAPSLEDPQPTPPLGHTKFRCEPLKQ